MNRAFSLCFLAFGVVFLSACSSTGPVERFGTNPNPRTFHSTENYERELVAGASGQGTQREVTPAAPAAQAPSTPPSYGTGENYEPVPLANTIPGSAQAPQSGGASLPPGTVVVTPQPLHEPQRVQELTSIVQDKADREQVFALLDARTALYAHELDYGVQRQGLRQRHGQSVAQQRRALQKAVTKAQRNLTNRRDQILLPDKQQQKAKGTKNSNIIGSILYGSEDITPDTVLQELTEARRAEARRARELRGQRDIR